MALSKRGNTWWYEFLFARQRIRESAKTTSKTVAKLAEQKRRRELELGFNGVEDRREERIRTVNELGTSYLENYRLRHKAVTFAEYAVGNVTRHLGDLMAVDVTEETVAAYQTTRLKETAAPKTVNEEVGFLLRLLGDAGDVIRARLRRRKSLKLAVPRGPGKAYTPEEKTALLAAARAARSPAICPALMLGLNAGMRDAEIRGLQWGRLDLSRAFLTIGDSKTEAGEGRTIPLNSALLETLVGYAKWYTRRFGTIQPEWYVFPVWQTAAEGSDASDGHAEDVVEQRSEESRRHRALARQPAHPDHGPGGERGRGRDHPEHSRARLQANAEALLPHPHASKTERARSDRS